LDYRSISISEKNTFDGGLPPYFEHKHSYETQPLPTKYLSPKEVLQFRDRAFNEYFTNRRYLDMVEQKFGKKVKSYILEMLQIKLERRLFN
jgi:anaerobic magnesium-protoporphyrin IX monomethyl ester cyclase